MKAYIIISIVLLFTLPAISQEIDELFIYGKITTEDNDTYTGVTRWGSEEAFWFDEFNSTKTENENEKYLSRRDRKYFDEDEDARRDRWFSRSWNLTTHVFACQFGDIKTIHIKGSSRVEVELKNGFIFELKGGSNDIGAKIKVLDYEIGNVELNWNRINKIEFMNTPSQLENRFGDPLYGTVGTYYGNFTGFVQWDHDERLSTDILDGKTKDGDVDIEFGKIKSIERDGRRSSIVKLQSGRELNLSGTNDVNHENKGIIVTVPGMGRVDIKWRDFKKLTFDSKFKNPGISYRNYAEPKKLCGTVTTNDREKRTGRIVYDLDEAWDMELLQGYDDELKYIIPFRHIKKITPKSSYYSIVELKNGNELRLESERDVTKDNDGVLVFEKANEPTYIPWREIKVIDFE